MFQSISLQIFIGVLLLGGVWGGLQFAYAGLLKEPRFLLRVIFPVLLSVASYFRLGFGYDYDSYYSLYLSLPDCGCYSKGPLFFSFFSLVKSLGISFDLALSFITFISVHLLVSVVIYLTPKRIILPTLLVLSLYFFVSLMGQVRQFLAIMVAAYAIVVISRNGYSFLLYCVSILIHPSLFVLFPAYILYRKDIFLRLNISITLLFASVFLGQLGLIYSFLPFMSELPVVGPYADKVISYHENWVQGGMSISFATVVFTQLLFFYLFHTIRQDRCSRKLYIVSLFGAVCVFLLMKDVHISGRIIKIFRVFDCLLLARLLYLGAHGSKSHILFKCGIAVFVLVFLIKDYYRLSSL